MVICVEALALTVRYFLLMWREALTGCKLVKIIDLADKSSRVIIVFIIVRLFTILCRFLDTKDINA